MPDRTLPDWTSPWTWASVGVVLLLVAIAWRWTHRRRTASRLAEALRADDPARRRAAVAVAAEQGLRQCGAMLLERSAAEQDPTVVDAIVGAVLRNSWEPADRPAILALRLWAHERRAGATPSGAAGAWTEPPVTAPVPRVPAADAPLPLSGTAGLFTPHAAPHRSPHLPRHRAAASIRIVHAPVPAAPAALTPTRGLR